MGLAAGKAQPLWSGSEGPFLPADSALPVVRINTANSPSLPEHCDVNGP